MKPGNGSYRLTTLPQPGIPSTSVVYTIDDAGLHTTFGILEWEPDPPPGAFVKGAIAIRFISPTEFVALNGPDNYAGTYGPP